MQELTTQERECVRSQLLTLYEMRVTIINQYLPLYRKLELNRQFAAYGTVVFVLMAAYLASSYLQLIFPGPELQGIRDRWLIVFLVAVLTISLIICHLMLRRMRPTEQMIILEKRFNGIDEMIKLKQALIDYKGPNHDLLGKVEIGRASCRERV